MTLASQPAKAPKPEFLPTRPTLLAKMRNQDDSQAWERGWEEFYAVYHPVIYGHAIRKGLGEAEADDVVQEIVVGVARSMPNFKYDPARCSFKTWLFQVARNKIADHLRRRGREARIIKQECQAEDGSPALMEIADENTLSPDREWDLMLEKRLREAALEHVRNRVKPMTMKLYLYHVVDGHNVEETVHAFRDSNVAREHVYVAKNRVQEMLNERLQRLRDGKWLNETYA